MASTLMPWARRRTKSAITCSSSVAVAAIRRASLSVGDSPQPRHQCTPPLHHCRNVLRCIGLLDDPGMSAVPWALLAQPLAPMRQDRGSVEVGQWATAAQGTLSARLRSLADRRKQLGLNTQRRAEFPPSPDDVQPAAAIAQSPVSRSYSIESTVTRQRYD